MPFSSSVMSFERLIRAISIRRRPQNAPSITAIRASLFVDPSPFSMASSGQTLPCALRVAIGGMPAVGSTVASFLSIAQE